MDVSTLWDTCKDYSAKEFHVKPIPEPMGSNARASLNIRSAELIVALIDLTNAGDAESALVLTEGGLYWKNRTDTAPTRLSWAQLSRRTIRERATSHGSSIDFGKGLELELPGASSLIGKVLDLLNELKPLAADSAPNQTVNPKAVTRARPSRSGLVECEFCGGKVKPDVTYCKHCGLKLRG